MMKILIIEDTEKLRKNIAYALRMEGYDVIEAADGETGVSMVQKHLPNLILCDIVMPGMNGYDVLKSIKSEDGILPIPFIFITALADRENFREGMDLGADDFLVKPFTIQELLNAINSRLTKYSSIERRFTLQVEEVEKEMKALISSLEIKNKTQRLEIDTISTTSTDAIKQLTEKRARLMEQSLQLIEINTTLQNIATEIMLELKGKELTEKQRQFLVELRYKIRKHSVLLNNWTIFQLEFDQTYPNFSANLINQYAKFTKQDRVIICAVYVNLDTPQISVILGITPSSVRKYKYRIKKKLGLGVEDNLYQHIHNMKLNE